MGDIIWMIWTNTNSIAAFVASAITHSITPPLLLFSRAAYQISGEQLARNRRECKSMVSRKTQKTTV